MALGLALHRQLREQEAEAVFDSALAQFDSASRADMTGLQTILREKDAKNYAALAGLSRVAADSMYWDVADPLRLTDVNEARTEFLSRVAYSDLRFSSDEFAQHGWRTDRGIVYIRYGPPPQIATFAPEGEERLGSDAIARVTTVWFYPATGLRFVFLGPPAMNYAAFASDFRSYADNARFLQPARFDNLGPLLNVDTVSVQVARFRADTGTGVDLSIFADIPTRRMLKDVDVTQATLETGLFISDGGRRTLVAARDSSVIRSDVRDSVTSRAWRRALPPGEYVYRIEARQAASGHAARGMAALQADAFPAGTLALSDVLVARRIVPRAAEPHSRSDFLVVPNASLTFAKRDTAYLYWEDYGLTRDSTGSARVRVELALHLTAIERDKMALVRAIGGLADAVGLTAEGDDRVVLRYDRTVPLDSRDRVPNYLALDLGDAPYGLYSIELKVTDLTSGRSATQQRSITVPRP
jgi:GWxTD domain-containing protein